MTIQNVIIGGGPVATNAIESIREFDQGQSQITLVCDEPCHSRMALPYWLSGQIPRGQTMTADDASLNRLNVQARIGVRATKVDPAANTVTLSDGGTLAFDNLLIATGASPAGLSIPGADLPGVQALWTLDQTQSLLDAVGTRSDPRVVMIGAGFIGFIILNAMHKRGWKLTVVEQAPQVLPRMLDAPSAGIVQTWLREQGVGLHLGAQVQAIHEAGDGSKRVELNDGQTVEADVVIIATGIRPNIDLAQGSGIQTATGILVNNRLQTNFPHIYAGGDVAEGPVLFSDRPAIHAIQPTAVDHGRVAGANMAGQDIEYPGSLLMNILDVCGLQCASFGNWSDSQAQPTTIFNNDGKIYRQLLWTGDEITGAIFVGRANDMGMLTDVGMVKGILQTRTPMGAWKQYLAENPFDIRRAYVATGVAQKLAGSTLLGRPTRNRSYRFGDAEPIATPSPSHAAFVATKPH
jgi:NAD(P)H-nitrite reductase large subunit